MPRPTPLAKALCLLALAAGLPSPAWTQDLLALYRLASERDATYLAAKSTAEAGRESVPQARAALLPQVSATWNISRNSTEQSTHDFLGRPVRREYDYTAEGAGLSLRQALYRPAALAALRSAQSRVEGIDAQLDKERQALAIRLAQAYFEALAARGRLDSLRAEQDAYAAQLAAAERAFRAGVGTRTDIDEAQARLDLARAREIEARLALTVAQRALAALTGEPVEVERLHDLDPAAAAFAELRPGALEDWIRLAETHNPELRALAAEVAAAEQEVRKSRAGHLPSVDLLVSRTLSDSESENIIGNRYWTTRLGAQLSLPLYAGGYVDSTVRQALANLEASRQRLESTRRQLGVDVNRAHAAVSHGAARIEALEVALRSAEQAVRASQKGLTAGTRHRVDVLNALQQEASVRYELYRARIDLLLGWLRLMQASGRLDEAELERANRALRPGPGVTGRSG